LWWYGGVSAELDVIVAFIDKGAASMLVMVMNIKVMELTHRLAGFERYQVVTILASRHESGAVAQAMIHFPTLRCKARFHVPLGRSPTQDQNVQPKLHPTTVHEHLETSQHDQQLELKRG
jgi:hypothetical protein